MFRHPGARLPDDGTPVHNALGWHPGAEAYKRLIFVVNCILLSSFVGGYTDCWNIHGKNNRRNSEFWVQGLTWSRTYWLRVKKKVKQSHYRPGGFQEVKVPRFRDNGTGWWQVVSLTHRPPLLPGNTPGTQFLLEAESTPGTECDRKNFMSTYTSWDRTNDLPICSTAP